MGGSKKIKNLNEMRPMTYDLCMRQERKEIVNKFALVSD